MIMLSAAMYPLLARAQANKKSVDYGKRFEVGDFSIHSQNDVFKLIQQTRSTDENFSNGIQIRSRFIPRSASMRRKWESFTRAKRYSIGLTFGQDIFTPATLKPSEVYAKVGTDSLLPEEAWKYWYDNYFPGDIPYSAAAYIRSGIELTYDDIWSRSWCSNGGPNLNPRTSIRATFEMGTIGEMAAGGPVQKGFHHLMREFQGSSKPYDPEGWGRREVEIDPITYVNLSFSMDRDILYFGVPTTTMKLPISNYWREFISPRTGMVVSLSSQSEFGWRSMIQELGATGKIGFLGALPLRGPEVEEPFTVGGDNSVTALQGVVELKGRFIGFDRHYDNDFGKDNPEARRKSWQTDLSLGWVGRLRPLEFRYLFTWRRKILERSMEPTVAGSDYHKFGEFSVRFIF